MARDARWKYYMNPAATELPTSPVEVMEKVLISHNNNIIDSFKNAWTNRHDRIFHLNRYRFTLLSSKLFKAHFILEKVEGSLT